MRKINILITGAGAPGIAGTIHALRFNEDRREMKIITVDARDNVVGKYLGDVFYKVPKADEPNFIDAIFEISRIEGVDVILPQVTRELEKFSKNIEKFDKIGVKLVVSCSESIMNSNNKYHLLKIFTKLGFEQGEFELIQSKEGLRDFADRIGFPKKRFVIKPPLSNGMRGLRIVTDERMTIEKFLNEKPSGEYASLDEILSLFDQGKLELLAMEYLPGKEYTVDVYRSPINQKIVAIPRTRDVIRSGITFEGRIEKNTEIIDMSIKLAETLNLVYCFGFQFKLDENGKPKLLECNPRVQGTMIMSVLAGANIIYWSVKESLGEEIGELESKINGVKWGMTFKRYWGGVAIYEGQTKKVLPDNT